MVYCIALASSVPLDSSPAAEWDLLAALRNMDLARPDPAAWAAGGAEWTDFSTDSAQPCVPAGPIQPLPGAAIARPAANRLPDLTSLPSRLHVCTALCCASHHCSVLYCVVLY